MSLDAKYKINNKLLESYRKIRNVISDEKQKHESDRLWYQHEARAAFTESERLQEEMKMKLTQDVIWELEHLYDKVQDRIRQLMRLTERN